MKLLNALNILVTIIEIVKQYLKRNKTDETTQNVQVNLKKSIQKEHRGSDTKQA